MIESGAALAAWLGAGLIVLADGRRGLACGLAAIALGFSMLAIAGGDVLAGAVIGAGGAVAALQRWRQGPPGWGVMPPGSTPRLVLCIASALLALWIAASITTGSGGQLRFAVLVVFGLTAARVLSGRDAPIVMTAVAGLALVLAAGSGLAGAAPSLLPYLAGALAAAGATFLPQSESNGA